VVIVWTIYIIGFDSLIFTLNKRNIQLTNDYLIYKYL